LLSPELPQNFSKKFQTLDKTPLALYTYPLITTKVPLSSRNNSLQEITMTKIPIDPNLFTTSSDKEVERQLFGAGKPKDALSEAYWSACYRHLRIISSPTPRGS
jgi:hypothetical protein